MKYIAVIDYGMGNLHSVIKALNYKNIPVKLTYKKSDIKKSSGIILPGVGAFRDAVKELKKRDIFDLIKDEVNNGKPILGICLGHQLLFSYSEEFGRTKGFDFIKGKAIRFPYKLKVPHMGWNEVIKVKKSKIFKNINQKYFYFVHSYYTVLKDKNVILTKTKYGNIIFTSGVEYNNIFGFQFHPEKSGEKALKIYENFYKFILKR